MNGRVTIKDIAKNTGVSVASVHRALHGSSGVSEPVRQKILDEVKNTGYIIDESAVLLRRNAVNITVLLPRPEGNSRFYYQGLWQGIEKAARKLEKQKARISMIRTEYSVRDLSRALEELYDEADSAGSMPDGLVTICDDEATAGWIMRFIRRGTKVALVDRSMPIDGLTCSAEVSVKDMGALAAKLAWMYLPDTGTSKGSILVVNGPAGRSSYRLYEDAVRTRIRELTGSDGTDGSAGALQVIPGEDERVVRQYLRGILPDNAPDVIIAASSRTTFWVCDEISTAYSGKNEKIYPPVIGTDVFPEQKTFFEEGILKAAIYQSHLSSGEQCLGYLMDSLINSANKGGRQFAQPLSVVFSENFKYFI